VEGHAEDLAIASPNPTSDIYAHVRYTCMLGVGSGPPKPVYGEILAHGPRAVYPLDFSE
jgi:hypothetical protein